jgi:thioredoxin-like negative regulator of GroEL
MFSTRAKLGLAVALALIVGIFLYRHMAVISSATATSKVKRVATTLPSSSFAKASSDDRLGSAREAFAQGEADRAVTLYNAYLEENPRDTDARGELGNVYYLSGRTSEAAQTLYDTANLLMANHQYDKVEPLLYYVAQAKPMMADELAQKLRKATGTETPGIGTIATAPETSMPEKSPQSALTRY